MIRHYVRTGMLMLATALVFEPVVCAGTVSFFSLQQCIEHARGSNEILRIQRERLIQADELVKQARGTLRPEVDFRYSRLFRDTDGGALAGDLPESKLALSQPLFQGFRNLRSIALNESNRTREEYQLQDIARRIDADVVRAFYGVVQVEADIKNVNDTAALIADRIQELRARARIGKSRESEVLMAASSLSTLQAQKEQFTASRSVSRESLALLIGVDAPSFEVTDTSGAVEHVEPLNVFLSESFARPDIRVLEQAIISQMENIRINQGLLLPSLSLDGSWYLMRAGALSGSDWDMLFSLNVPLYHGGTLRSRIRAEKSVLAVTQGQLDLLKRNVRTEILSVHTVLLSSIAQVNAFNDAYTKAEKSYRLQLADYRYGLVNNLDVMQAMTSLLVSKQSLDRAVIQTRMNKLLLDAAAGRLQVLNKEK